MRSFVIASPEGGTGKSKIAGHLAVDAGFRRVGPVAIVETDPPGSLAEWWNARESPTPMFAAVDIAELPTRFAALDGHGIRLVNIDTPSVFTPATFRTLAVADLLMPPSAPARTTSALPGRSLRRSSSRASRSSSS